MDPYRTTSLIAGSKQEFGLIRVPKPPKPHRCSPPGELYRLWLLLTGRAITVNSLWRCQCGNIFRVGEYGLLSGTWHQQSSKSGMKLWEEKGGYVSPQFRVAEELANKSRITNLDDDEEDWEDEDDEDEDEA